MPNFKLILWDNAQLGKLKENHVYDLITENKNPHVYICESQGLEIHINEALKKIKYDKNKIHILWSDKTCYIFCFCCRKGYRPVCRVF